ncbi:hypothetical protein IWW34DRAFT_601883 [Fusarium oxysporum f. sp. albedinis]|nr:hypothetical protein IWW34DRAFT_601883 [Fusarium oxysporum f. sp. albedinis]KAJ0157400.1 Uncharacterized protein HZ326_0326 [Fusarium oxysporum f. sp. albedinis]KAK2483448.1 hypothetical protein H9L39_05240 [Fusarium oxysporum f. sp. albedinis]
MVSECFGVFSNNNGAASETADVEKHGGQDIQQGPLGFAALSSLMVSDGDQELLIFRRFDDISTRNLLYLQCELLSIEDRLKKWDRNVLKSRNTKLEEVAYRWEEMVKQAKEGKDEAKEMMELVYQLRSKIKEYHEALELQSRVARLHPPDKRALKVARNELWGGPLETDGLKPSPIVGGKAKDYLDRESDLVSVKAPVETDLLSKTLRAVWPGKEETSRDGLSRISRFDERSVAITVATINIIFAIILLVGPITSLSYVSSRAAVLGMICTFTALFAISLGLMTKAKRAEIFAGSAAYTAVLMVYVSNGDFSSGK